MLDTFSTPVQWMSANPLPDWLSSGAAFGGLVLGLYNFWSGLTRLKVKLLFASAASEKGPIRMLSIQVVNHGKSAVYITDFGFTRGWNQRRLAIHPHQLLERQAFPVRIGPQESVNFTFPAPDDIGERSSELSRVYARTATAKVFKHRSATLRRLKELRQVPGIRADLLTGSPIVLWDGKDRSREGLAGS